MADAMAAFGARPEDVELARQQQVDRDFLVYPENWLAVKVFLEMGTQWRAVAASLMTRAQIILTGLDYGTLPTVLRFMNVKRKHHAAVFQKIRVMEEAALDALTPK